MEEPEKEVKAQEEEDKRMRGRWRKKPRRNEAAIRYTEEERRKRNTITKTKEHLFFQNPVQPDSNSQKTDQFYSSIHVLLFLAPELMEDKNFSVSQEDEISIGCNKNLSRAGIFVIPAGDKSLRDKEHY